MTSILDSRYFLNRMMIPPDDLPDFLLLSLFGLIKFDSKLGILMS